MAQTKVDALYYTITRGNSPLIATAIHSGHDVRRNIKDFFFLSEKERLREEDPFTDQWVSVADNQITGHNSRFEMDLNRPRERAIYRKPEDTWGLQVWKNELADELALESLAHYDKFYEDVKLLLTKVQQQHGCFVVYDLHTYNHKREGASGPAADPEQNPEVNIGTGNMNREKWAPVVDTFMHTLSSYNYNGRRLDVRENVKFQGGHFMRWIHDTFPNKACVLSIKFKKFFMDEWTGKPDQAQLQQIKQALEATTRPVLEALAKVCQV
ncbi:N-formylglutamate amidohydrolase [Pontibacter silvestris]|uniref:N-formylglutamate amidohydrolase n=1 Tax=Pontibacter silvestris TaxID=2305183 RepID=A0ABW4WY56_9BACT|nr:N-formylglutamate amidohydrolase [Pontibacter silvestris]MCC9138515.1 N-formylglutamate amidohydrolase [Pontibacter silvestris]